MADGFGRVQEIPDLFRCVSVHCAWAEAEGQLVLTYPVIEDLD